MSGLADDGGVSEIDNRSICTYAMDAIANITVGFWKRKVSHCCKSLGETVKRDIYSPSSAAVADVPSFRKAPACQGCCLARRYNIHSNHMRNLKGTL